MTTPPVLPGSATTSGLNVFDARLGIGSRTLTIEQLFARGRFQPASVQREYQWEQSNCETLLEDLKHALEPRDDAPEPEPGPEPEAPHTELADSDDDDTVNQTLIPDLPAVSEPPVECYYLGALVVKPYAGGRIDVYDGLQRLTTLTILIAVLRDLTKTNALGRRLGALIFDSNFDPRLTLRTGNGILKDEIQKPGAAATDRRTRRGLSATDQRIRVVTAYFYRQIGKWSDARIDRFSTRLLEAACVGLTEVADERIARQIFVSTNLHGVRLNRVDLCKGQLMDLAADDTAAAAILQIWTRLQNRIGTQFDAFLVAADFIERREPQGVDCLTRLAAHIAATQGPAKIVAWVEELERSGDAWIGLHDRMATLHGRSVDAEIWKLRMFWWPEWKPLALLWYRDYLSKCNAKGHAPHSTWIAFNKRFAALHGRCLALILADFTPFERARIFGNAIGQTRTGSDPLKAALAFNRNALDKIRQSLIVPLTDESKRHASIRWIEASLWDNKIPAYLGEATVEHVLPQRSAEGSDWRSVIADEEERYDAAHSLGNLAMLDKSRNGLLSNASYASKRAEYLKLPAFKTLEQVAAIPEWTRETIREREKMLAAYVLEKLALPEYAAKPRIPYRDSAIPPAAAVAPDALS